MIDKERLKSVVDGWLGATPMYLTDLNVGADNAIYVEIDSDGPVDIDACAALTRHIEEAFDRDVEDYSLEVGSAGITSPLKVRRQFVKYIGEDVEVLTGDGRKIHGVLSEVSGADDGMPVEFTVQIPVKHKEPGVKKPVIRMEDVRLSSDICKYVRYDLKF